MSNNTNELVKMFHEDAKFHNSPLSLPIDGLVHLKDGIALVTESCAQILETIPGWSRVKKSGTKTKKENKKQVQAQGEIQEPEEEGIEEEPEEEPEEEFDNEDIAAFNATLDEMNLEELIEVAKKSDVPRWELFEEKESALRTYLKGQLSKR